MKLTKCLKLSHLQQCLFFSLGITSSVFAQVENIEVITVTSDKSMIGVKSIATEQVSNPDVGSWLESVPGANVNRNGPLTSVAQYRGLFGDRVSAKLNSRPVIGAGPNAMDSPLSYSPAIITESLSVHRGIAPVSAGIETLGGAIDVQTQQAQFSQGLTQVIDGKIKSSFEDNNDATRIGGVVNIGQENFAVMAYLENSQGNDGEAANGVTLFPTRYEKTQTGLNTKVKLSDNVLGFSYDYTDTNGTGTPALPMDITYIYGNRFSVDGSHHSLGGELTWQLGYVDADHVMDNFTYRENLDPSGFRSTKATSDSYDFSVNWQDEHWQVGIGGYLAKHDAEITNPNNESFQVVNFNNVEDNRIGLFTQWNSTYNKTNLHVGLRTNYISADAEDVSHHMAMMNPIIGERLNEFNNADKGVHDTNVDVAVHVNHELTKSVNISMSLARKERAPSYQERYLWVPMEATGGLADGNTYLGNINLSSEVSYQSNIGFNYVGNLVGNSAGNTVSIIFDAHYQRIDDYIQGVPSTDMAARNLAQMMSNDDNLLQFDNVEASLYGIDSQLDYQINDNLYSKVMFSFVRGQRKDINDHLYRIAPMKGQVKLGYQQEKWDASIMLNMVAEQDKVSETNQEQETSGYGYTDINIDYYFNHDLVIKAGVNNVFNKDYEDHLSAYNRVNNADTPVMSRFPSKGRNFRVEIAYQF